MADYRMRRLAVAVAGALLLALAPVAPVVAQDVSEADPVETTLTGQLSTDEMGGYVLIEVESGDSVVLKGDETLADHVGTNVIVTGTWAEDDDGVRYFQVTEVEASTT